MGRTPGLALGIQAIVGTIWWILIMFVEVKNSSLDIGIFSPSGFATVPIGWWWSNMQSETYNMLAVSLFFSWLFYLAVSVVELVAWILYMVDLRWFARFYFSTVGYWGSLVAYFIPVFLLILYIAITL